MVRIAHLSSKKLIAFLASEYGILSLGSTKVTIHEYSQGYMNHVLQVDINAARYVVVIYNSMRYRGQSGVDFISELSRISEYLNAKNFPARRAILAKRGVFVSQMLLEGQNSNPHLVGLYEYLPGNTLEWDGYTRRHLRALGEKMGQMHNLLSEYNSGKRPSAIQEWPEYFERDNKRLMTYIGKHTKSITKKLQLKVHLNEVEKLIKTLGQQIGEIPLRSQLIHCDFVRGNILFSETKLNNTYPIIGVLDFEKMLYGPVIVDVARTLAFLLVDCRYKTEAEILKYFLHEGYIVLGKGSVLSVLELDPYMVYFWLRDFWKFLECNPYEDLKKNYHFNKTVEILMEKKLLSAI
jgi:Ser/Thr protein kinase RdoA (MazF antagonist)